MLEGLVPGIRAFGERAERQPAELSAEERWRAERAEAFELFDDARLLRAYRLATLILRDRDDAEDATQEAIARAWSSWGSLRDRDRFEAWFERILVNVCRNRLRHAGTIRMVSLEAAGASDGGGSDAPAFGTSGYATPAYGADAQARLLDRLALEPAFDRLSPEHRIIVVLRFWRDLTVDEIADRLAIPPGTVKSRLHYALKELRVALERADREGTAIDRGTSRRGSKGEVRRD